LELCTTTDAAGARPGAALISKSVDEAWPRARHRARSHRASVRDAGTRRPPVEAPDGTPVPLYDAVRTYAPGRRGNEISVRRGRCARDVAEVDRRLHVLRAARHDSGAAAARRLRRRHENRVLPALR